MEGRTFGAGGKTQGARCGRDCLFWAVVLALLLLPAVLPRLHPERQSWCGKSGLHLYAGVRDQRPAAAG